MSALVRMREAQAPRRAARSRSAGESLARSLLALEEEQLMRQLAAQHTPRGVDAVARDTPPGERMRRGSRQPRPPVSERREAALSAEMARRIAEQGRGGDTEIAHVTPGEVVLPPEVMAQLDQGALERAFKAAGLDMGRYTVGGGDDARNPATGVREYRGGGAEGTGDPGPNGGGEGGPGAEDPSEGFTGPGGAADAPSRGGPTGADVGDGGEAAIDPVVAAQPMDPTEIRARMVAEHEVEHVLPPTGTFTAENEEEAKARREAAWDESPLLGLLGMTAVGKIARGLDIATATPSIVDAEGNVVGTYDPDRGFSPPGGGDTGAGEGGEGRDQDTLPGAGEGPEEPTGQETEPEGGPLTDVTPWEGVPEVTQASLPQGWLGSAQGNILAAHQAAQRMGAW